jgi:hypothetical protein
VTPLSAVTVGVAEDNWGCGEMVEEPNSGAEKERGNVDVDFVKQSSVEALLDDVGAVSGWRLRRMLRWTDQLFLASPAPPRSLPRAPRQSSLSTFSTTKGDAETAEIRWGEPGFPSPPPNHHGY